MTTGAETEVTRPQSQGHLEPRSLTGQEGGSPRASVQREIRTSNLVRRPLVSRLLPTLTARTLCLLSSSLIRRLSKRCKNFLPVTFSVSQSLAESVRFLCLLLFICL